MDVGDGTMIGQSAAIMRYIGKKTGLYPSEDVVAALVDSIIDHVSLCSLFFFHESTNYCVFSVRRKLTSSPVTPSAVTKVLLQCV